MVENNVKEIKSDLKNPHTFCTQEAFGQFFLFGSKDENDNYEILLCMFTREGLESIHRKGGELIEKGYAYMGHKASTTHNDSEKRLIPSFSKVGSNQVKFALQS